MLSNQLVNELLKQPFLIKNFKGINENCLQQLVFDEKIPIAWMKFSQKQNIQKTQNIIPLIVIHFKLL